MSLQGVFQTHRMQDLWIYKATVSNHGVFIVGTEGPSPTYIPKEGVSINSFPGDFFFFCQLNITYSHLRRGNLDLVREKIFISD